MKGNRYGKINQKKREKNAYRREAISKDVLVVAERTRQAKKQFQDL